MRDNRTTIQRISAQRRRAFTLVEVTIATAILSLLFVGTLTLFVAASQISVKTDVTSYSASDAANAVQHVRQDAREAFYYSLPDDTNTAFTPPNGLSIANFEANNQGTIVDTAVQFTFPGTASVSVQNASGTVITPSPTIYNRSTAPTAPANMLLIYRSDAGGIADPTAGQFLWMLGTEHGVAVNQALLKTVSATSVSAVQFLRPMSADPSPVPINYQLEIKLVSSYSSPIGKSQNSEGTTGAAIVGKCALMRDHELDTDHQPPPTHVGTVGGTTNSD